MLKTLGITLVLILLPLLTAAGTGVSLQFLHPLATTPRPNTDTAVRLSLLWGRSGSISHFDAGLVGGLTEGDLRGLQWQSLYAGVNGDLHGAGVTAGVHRVVGQVRGAQIGVVAAWSDGLVQGVQASSALSFAEQGVIGAQVGGLMTVSDGPTRYFQYSTVATVSVGEFTGWQLAGFFAHANTRLVGLQTALLNSVDEGHGLQMGTINIAREMSGLQLGIINVSDRMHGLPLGLINLQKGSPRSWLVYGTNLSVGNFGFRSDVNGWLSTISVGYGDAQGDQSQAGSLGWHFGRRFLGDTRRWLAVEMGLLHIMPDGSDDPAVNDRPHPVIQYRVSGEMALSEDLALWGALGLSEIGRSYDEVDEDDHHSDIHIAAGVVLR